MHLSPYFPLAKFQNTHHHLRKQESANWKAEMEKDKGFNQLWWKYLSFENFPNPHDHVKTWRGKEKSGFCVAKVYTIWMVTGHS